jgi:hypothetical protein
VGRSQLNQLIQPVAVLSEHRSLEALLLHNLIMKYRLLLLLTCDFFTDVPLFLILFTYACVSLYQCLAFLYHSSVVVAPATCIPYLCHLLTIPCHDRCGGLFRISTRLALSYLTYFHLVSRFVLTFARVCSVELSWPIRQLIAI